MFSNAIDLMQATSGETLFFLPLILFYILMFVMIFVIFALAIASYIVNAIAIFKLAKKHGLEYPFLAFVPVFNIYLLTKLPGDKPFTLLGGSIKFDDRAYAFGIFAAASSLASLLGIIATVVAAFVNYGLLKDVLDMYSDDLEGNNKKAIIATVLDYIFTMGIIRGILLLKLTGEKKDDAKEEDTPAIEESITE
ncbi:MAG: hypothetical protein Q4D44_04125 [Eubacteriales bacterium]|nr:hypothetical protein [Eubacteriales bacterium]